MGKGRFLTHAAHSKITPPAGSRWAPKANARARCMGRELGPRGSHRGDWMGASNACKVKGS